MYPPSLLLGQEDGGNNDNVNIVGRSTWNRRSHVLPIQSTFFHSQTGNQWWLSVFFFTYALLLCPTLYLGKCQWTISSSRAFTKLRIILQKLEAIFGICILSESAARALRLISLSTSGGKQNESRAITEDREEKWELGGWGRHKYLFVSDGENGCNSLRIRQNFSLRRLNDLCGRSRVSRSSAVSPGHFSW